MRTIWPIGAHGAPYGFMGYSCRINSGGLMKFEHPVQAEPLGKLKANGQLKNLRASLCSGGCPPPQPLPHKGGGAFRNAITSPHEGGFS